MVCYATFTYLVHLSLLQLQMQDLALLPKSFGPTLLVMSWPLSAQIVGMHDTKLLSSESTCRWTATAFFGFGCHQASHTA